MAPSPDSIEYVISSMPAPMDAQSDLRPRSILENDHIGSTGSTRSGSASEAESTPRNGRRPKIHTRKSSGTIIISRDAANIELYDEQYEEGDARTMSPRRSIEEVDRLEEGLRQNMIEQSRQLQASLLSLVDRVESVKAEHEKLEGGNRFLQSYIGELMQTSQITATGAAKGKGKSRITK